MSAEPTMLMYSVLQKRDEINSLTVRMPQLRCAVFKPLNLSVPTFAPAELGFLRTVAYLYVLYYEAGRSTLEVVLGASPAYEYQAIETVRRHPVEVRSLRTMLQHNVDPLATKDTRVNSICSEWFRRGCGSLMPGSEEQWHGSLQSLLFDAVRFCTFVCDIIRFVEADDDCERIVGEWARRISRTIEPHEFDSLISVAANDMGRPEVDPVFVRKRYYQRWSEHLLLLQSDIDVLSEARKLIEYVLLTEVSRRLPISGHDIIIELGVTPGHLVGELLQFARVSFEGAPCGRDELLDRVGKKLADPS